MENKQGAISPQEALEYMKNTKDLYIIDAAPAEMYDIKHFSGAVSMPYAEMPDRFEELPKDRPVLIHCRMGHIAPHAYRLLRKKRRDIADMRYIDGAPLFDEYNKSVKK